MDDTILIGLSGIRFLAVTHVEGFTIDTDTDTVDGGIGWIGPDEIDILSADRITAAG